MECVGSALTKVFTGPIHPGHPDTIVICIAHVGNDLEVYLRVVSMHLIRILESLAARDSWVGCWVEF